MEALAIALCLLSATIEGRVVGVIDGDTIDVLSADQVTTRVRLSGIDTPERRQAFGTRAKEALSAKIAGKTVTVETHGQDRYGRTLGVIILGGRNINLEMVREGMAWAFTRYHPPAEYVAAEQAARAEHRGLWADDGAIPPWEWREREREKRKAVRPKRQPTFAPAQSPD